MLKNYIQRRNKHHYQRANLLSLFRYISHVGRIRTMLYLSSLTNLSSSGPGLRNSIIEKQYQPLTSDVCTHRPCTNTTCMQYYYNAYGCWQPASWLFGANHFLLHSTLYILVIYFLSTNIRPSFSELLVEIRH